MYSSCTLCGRNCGVDREKQIGYCRESSVMRIALASLHFGEEPPIVGRGGSGTVFFSGCSLGCSICQNFQISRGEKRESRSMGREVGVEEFARICLTLQREGAENINLVTGTHFIPSILEGLRIAGEAGLSLPIVWNSSGFDSVTALSLLAPEVDIFLVDCKTLDGRVAERFCNTSEYPQVVREGLDFIVQNRALEIDKDEEGLHTLRRGVIIRHLVIPGYLESTRMVLRLYSRKYREKAVLSLMAQYTPPANEAKPRRTLSAREYEEVLNMFDEFGIEDGFLQEPEFAVPEEREWLPDFSKWKVFPSDLAKTVWHHQF